MGDRRRHPVLTSLAALALLAATGCGAGGPGGEGPPTGAATGTAVDPNEPATESAQPESEYREPTATRSATRRPRPSIGVAGPTLDDHFPEVWGVLTGPGRYKCNVYTSGVAEGGGESAGVPVTVESVRMVDQRPAGSPGLSVIEGPPCEGGHGTAETGYPIRTGCTGVTLPPFAEEARGCSVGIRATGVDGTDYTAVLRFTLTAACESRGPRPCDGLPPDARPTVERPVQVSWTTERPIAACLSRTPEQRTDGYTEEEQEGRCPAASPSPETSPGDPTEGSPSEGSPSEGSPTEGSSPTPSADPT